MAVIAQLPQYDFEWIVIDNKSTDDSRHILRTWAAEDRRIKPIFNTRNFGPQRSGAFGLYQTTGEASIIFGADLQEPPELIPKFLQAWEDGADVALGHIVGSEESPLMFGLRGCFYTLMRGASSHTQFEHVTGFGLYSNRIVRLMAAENNPLPTFRFSVTDIGCNATLIDFTQPKRQKGQSSFGMRGYINAALDMLFQYSYQPTRIIIFSGALLAVVALPLFIGTALLGCVNNNTGCLFVSTWLLLAFFSGLLALAIGVVGEYAVLANRRIKREPLVYVEDRINFNE